MVLYSYIWYSWLIKSPNLGMICEVLMKNILILAVIFAVTTGCGQSVSTKIQDPASSVANTTAPITAAPAPTPVPAAATTGAPAANQQGPAVSPTTSVEDKRIAAKVTRVVDGDTLEVTISGKKETIRMILVDTPETKKPNTPIQPFGEEASAFTKETLEGKDVKLERDVSERDQYKRLLYYVYLGDKSFNEMLLEKGLARVAVYPPDVKYVDQFREKQKKAQEAKLGIWSIENYATDKGYDESKTKKESVAEKPKQVEPPKPAPTPAASNVHYNNCTEVKKAGKAPIRRGEPGYSSKLDRDNDGIACE
jgi:micrococcal nuclease